jgi:hypothetical protein
MATTSFTAPRRIAGFAITLMLLSLCLTGLATGQGSPLVTASAPIGLTHPTGWGTIRDTATDTLGDWFVVDYSNGALYEFPAGGGPMLTLGAPGPSGSSGSIGSGNNPGIAIDPNNNIYLEANWNNCLVMFPYLGSNKWAGLNAPSPQTLSLANPTTTICTNSGTGNQPQAFAQYGLSAPAGSGFPGYFQPWGIAIGSNDNLIVANQNSGNYIFSLSVTGAWASPKAGPITSEPITGMSARPISVAQDPAGNIYFVEEPGQTHALPGVYEIPESVLAAGTAGELTTDCPTPATGPPTGSTCLTRVDPNLPTVTGVITDSVGNLYISDASDGVFMVPNPSGGTGPQPANAVMLTPVLAQGEVAIDWAHKILYVPTTQKQNNGQGDVAEVGIGYAELGSSTVGKTAATTTPVAFSFNGSATPASFVIVEGGMTNPDFTITGGTCTTGVAYAALASCVQNIAFTPSTVGNISAKLLMLDAKKNIIASIVLHGTGMGANVQTSPALLSSIGKGLTTPSQVATDALDNVYIADPGQKKVLKYAAGSSSSSTAVSIGTGWTSPTGVAVDGAGDVFIADSGTGSVYEIPMGLSGLNAAGQVTLVSGLGTSGLNLAVDALDNLYIADPSDHQVVKLSNVSASTVSTLGQSETVLATGFSAPSAVAVDSSNNLYVIDGANLFELAGGVGAPKTLLTNLSGATGVAVDPSGAVYITSAGGTTRVPFVGSALNPAGEAPVASTVSNTSAVALDRLANVYLTQASGGAVTLVTTNGTLSLSTPPLTGSTNATATITNAGNSALTVTGYTDTNPANAQQPSYLQLPVDFTAADTTSGGCVASSPIAPGATCTVQVTFAPGAGEQGTLTGLIGVASSAIDIPETITATGTGAGLANSVANIAAGTHAAEVVNTPLTITVAPKSGTVTPTGTVTVVFTSWNVIIPTSGANANIPTINPITASATATLTNGTANFTLSPVLAGTQTITVNYSGDRVYGRSVGTMSATIAQSAIAGFGADPNAPPYLPFVLESGAVSGSIPYDGSQAYWQYTMPVVVNTAAGVPTGTLTFMDNSSTCPPGTSTTGQGAAFCLLANYSGAACPEVAGASVTNIQNAGVHPTGATGNFATGCLQMPQFTTYTPVISTHYITPVFSGDRNFLGATDPVSTLFQALRSPELLIAASPSTLTVTSGSTASTTLTLTSVLGYGYAGKGSQLNDYNFPVTLTCDNLPPHAVCSFTYPTAISSAQPSAPNSVQIPCTGTTAAADNCLPGIVTMTINTSVSVGTTTSQNAAVSSVTLAAIFGFGMIGLFFRRKIFLKGRVLLMVFLMIVAGAFAISLTACNTTNLTPGADLISPAGTYAVTVTAEQVGSQVINLPTGPVTIAGSENQVSVPFYVNVTVQ